MFFLCFSCFFFVVSSSFPLFFLVFSIFPPFMFVWYCVGRCHFCPRRSTPKSTPVHAGLRGIVWGDTICVWYCVGRYDFCLVLCGVMPFLCGIVWGDAIFVHAGPRQNPRQSTPVYGVLCGAIPFLSGIVWGDTIFVWYCVGRWHFLCGIVWGDTIFVWYCVGRWRLGALLSS